MNETGKLAVSLLLVDDHPVVLEGLSSGLAQFPELNISGTAASLAEAKLLIEQGGFDLLVTDLNMPEVSDGIELIRYAGIQQPGAKIVVLTYSDSVDNIYQVNQAGAHAYIIKDCDLEEIATSLLLVHRGGRPPLKPELEASLWRKFRETSPDEPPYGLNEREWRILELMAGGATNEEIAGTLFISDRVVRRSNTSIYHKLGVRNRSEAIARAIKENLLG
ncbi:MAG: DNA-binding response regulator [Gaiellales bacterium]|nr:MAG: DNA-binding response regulator [Gaiellales bacterium]